MSDQAPEGGYEQVPDSDHVADELRKAAKIAPANAMVLHRVITFAGVEELNNSWRSLLSSAIAGGVIVSCSLLAEAALYAAIPEAPWREVIVGLGYSVGFILVIFSSVQLFTESTITAALPLFYEPTASHGLKTFRLWGLVILGNMIGVFFDAYLFVTIIGENAHLQGAMVAISSKILALDVFHTFINAMPAGFLIAILVWMRPNAGGSSFWCILVVLWLVGVCGFTHSIVGSCEAFVLLLAGKTSVFYTFFCFILPALLGNTVGGAVVFGLLAHAHVSLSKTHKGLNHQGNGLQNE